ncbi:hypothetical protein Aperf_G00000100991 [Anoplocephala perfoliata]
MEERKYQYLPPPVVCDCGEEFLAHFAGKAFSTFDAFNKVLLAFQEATGMQFMMKRTCLFNEGTLAREFLIYRYMSYACVRHIRPSSKMGQRVGGTGCQAYFSVGTRKHKLFVRQYDMQHNHPAHMTPVVEIQQSLPPLPASLPSPPSTLLLNPSSSPLCFDTSNGDASTVTVQDFTVDFLRIFGSNVPFDSFAELQAKMDEFQLVTGNRYVKTNTRRLPPGSPAADRLVYSHLVYICFRYGSKISEAKQRRLQRTTKIGCRSKIYFYSHNGQLHIRRYDFRHNHEVRPDLVHFPPKRRRTKKEKEEEQALVSIIASSTDTNSSPVTPLPGEGGEEAKQEFDSKVPLVRGLCRSVHADMAFSEPNGNGFAEDIGDEGEGDDEFLEDEELSHFCLQQNGFGHDHNIDEDFRTCFQMEDLDIPIQSQQTVESGGCFAGYPMDGMIPHEYDNLEIDVPKSLPRESLEVLLSPQLQRLGELASDCGPMKFASRLRELKALGDKWKRPHSNIAGMRLILGLWVTLIVGFINCLPVNQAPKKKNETAAFEIEDMSKLSQDLRSNLRVLRYQLNHEYLDLLRKKHERPENAKITINLDLAAALKIGNPVDIDVDVVLKKIRERLDAIDKEELAILNEYEISKVLDRWEDSVNDSAAERKKAQQEFEANKTANHKEGRFHEPGSIAQEGEQWQKGDELPFGEYNPRKFFLRHDSNGDGFWDSEEIDTVLSSELRQLDEDRPERAAEYRIQMRRNLIKSMDKDGDGLISYKEHMDFADSIDGINDDGWEPDDDDDEDLDDFGPDYNDKEISEIAAKIRHLESVDPDSAMIEQLKDRFVHLKKEIELNRSRYP